VTLSFRIQSFLLLTISDKPFDFGFCAELSIRFATVEVNAIVLRSLVNASQSVKSNEDRAPRQIKCV